MRKRTSATKCVVRVFLSSPGDAGAQRDLARQVIGALNSDPIVSARLIVETIGWDTQGARVPLSANVTPQASINAYLLRPSECDLTVVLLWGRLGTPLPSNWTDLDGRRYESGTVWEIEDAKRGGRPVWVYRKTATPHVAVDDPALEEKRAQLEAVRKFVGMARADDGSIRFGVHDFENDEEFRSLFSEHLRHFISDFLGSDAVATRENVPVEDDLSTSVASSIAAEAAVEAARIRPDGEESAEPPKLRDLHYYPAGPMLKDIVVGALALAIAELSDGKHPRTVLAEINNRLADVAPGLPHIRLVHVMFPGNLGSSYFWEEVLHYAAVHGPRVLAATLGIVDPNRLDSVALSEYEKLVRRLNSYL